jgi:phenol 2-monooxygenase
MAVRSLGSTTWERGVAEPSTAPPAWADLSNFVSDTGESAHYDTTIPGEKPTSDATNDLGTSSLRTWPDLFNGTASSRVLGDWIPKTEVDVLICGG